MIKFFVANSNIHVYVDTECEAILKNKQFVKNKCFEIEIYMMTIFLRIKNIDAITHETNEYVKILIFCLEIIKNEKQILIRLIQEIHLKNELKYNFLIENDFLEFEKFTININSKKAFIENCDVNINVSIKQRQITSKKH